MVRIFKKSNGRELGERVKTVQGVRHDVLEQDVPILVPYSSDFGTQINVISAPSTVV